MMKNLILETDSYKLSHYSQYPEDTLGIYSYFEARKGAEYPYTVFFGLQYILQEYLEGQVVDILDVAEAHAVAEKHFGNPDLFNLEGWTHIVKDHGGRLPVRIKAVKEGSVIPINNVLMTVENTCDKCYWLTNALESLLTHVWYPTTVATRSHVVRQMMKGFLSRTSDNDVVNFMLHDFGYRGASSAESAAIGGAGHLVNFLGTDTLPAMLLAMEHYSADLNTLAFSVPATEHSVMTAEGPGGELAAVQRLLDNNPTGLISCVADSYDYYKFVEQVGTTFKDQILERDGVFVVRPDSVTGRHNTPDSLVLWTLNQLWKDFGGTTNSKLYRVLNPKVRILWGDGIDEQGIKEILMTAQNIGYSAENIVFGMGGGLLQKLNRDTQRFAFKCSARKTRAGWQDVFKEPLDRSKASKAGRLALIEIVRGHYQTVNESLVSAGHTDQLQLVFENGKLFNQQTFDDIRARAA